MSVVSFSPYLNEPGDGIKLTKDLFQAADISGMLDKEDLYEIGCFVHDGFEKDCASRVQWLERNKAAMRLAMQVTEAKSFPWPGASNVAFPLVTIATLQFHSRAYPAILSGTDIVKYRTANVDNVQEAERAARIGAHMSYQLLEEDTAWEEQQDRLLINIPIVGCAFKKTYYDGSRGHNVSELVLAQDLVLDYYAKSVETCARKTHIVQKSRNDIYSKVKRGIYRNVLEEAWYKEPAPGGNTWNERDTRRDSRSAPPSDEATPFTLLEQHCWLDLDKDGYAEPYIVTIEKESQCVLRIVCRWEREEDIERTTTGEIISIRPTEYFTKYGFIPSPDASIYDMGFGSLLGPLNESVNTNINQLIDAGTMSNAAGGFLGRGAKIRGGAYTFAPFEWKRVDSTGDDLSKSIFPLPVREPSAVLFQLLSLLIQYTDRISGSTEAMVGEDVGQNTKVGTYNGMVEQGQKVYAAIFKRVWRSMKEEFEKLYVLNAIHLTSARGYIASRGDYLGDPNKVCPVADPNVVSDTVRFMQAQALAERAATVPGYNPMMVEQNYLKALKIEGWERFYPGPDKIPPAPDPKLVLEQAKQAGKMEEIKQRNREFAVKMMEEVRVNSANIANLEAQAKLAEAKADAEPMNAQIQAFNASIGALKTHNEALLRHIEHALREMEIRNGGSAEGSGVGGLQQLALPSGDAASHLVLPVTPTSPDGGMGLGGSVS